MSFLDRDGSYFLVYWISRLARNLALAKLIKSARRGLLICAGALEVLGADYFAGRTEFFMPTGDVLCMVHRDRL